MKCSLDEPYLKNIKIFTDPKLLNRIYLTDHKLFFYFLKKKTFIGKTNNKFLPINKVKTKRVHC